MHNKPKRRKTQHVCRDKNKKNTSSFPSIKENMTFICTAESYSISELHTHTTSLMPNLLFVIFKTETLIQGLPPRQSETHKGASVLLAFASQTIAFVFERKACVSRRSGITQGRVRTAAITIILDSIIVCLMGHPGPGAAIKL